MTRWMRGIHKPNETNPQFVFVKAPVSFVILARLPRWNTTTSIAGNQNRL